MTLDLNAIEARANAATFGPWIVVADPFHRSFYAALPDTLDALPLNVANAEFIAHARTDVPALIERVKELEGLVDTHEDHLYDLTDALFVVEHAVRLGFEITAKEAVEHIRKVCGVNRP